VMFPSVLGYVCYHPCEDVCRREELEGPVAICDLKRHAAEADLPPLQPGTDTGKSVAVIGGGPAGLASACYLRLLGHGATVFEAEEEVGGMLRYGIPKERLPRERLDRDLAVLDELGVSLETGRRLGANLPVEELKTVDQQVRENVFLDRLISTLATAFAVLATILASVGLYGVLSYIVAQRTREIGLRMALGADRTQVRTMVLRQLGRMLLVGCVVGILGAVALGRAAESLLFGMEGSDPIVVVLVTVLLSGIALAAGFLPARRASRVDPMEALRYE